MNIGYAFFDRIKHIQKKNPNEEITLNKLHKYFRIIKLVEGG